MKKILFVAVAAIVALAAPDGFCKKGKGKGKKKTKEPVKTEITVAPTSDQIAPMIADFKWGMTHEEVLKVLSDKVTKEYQAKMAKVNDSIKEDKLHQQMMQKIETLKKSYVEFGGQVTGYDSSLIKTEYTHGNNEAALVFTKDLKTDRKWTDYYFFVGDRLWKIFREFDAEMFPGLKWDDVQVAMAKKFGEGPLPLKEFDQDTKEVNLIGLQWQDEKNLLTLLNYYTFYGIFCLRFEDKETLKQIDTLRPNKMAQQKKKSVVDAITEGTGADPNTDIVDQITKKKKKDK